MAAILSRPQCVKQCQGYFIWKGFIRDIFVVIWGILYDEMQLARPPLDLLLRE